MGQISLSDIAIIPVVTGIVEVIKRSFPFPIVKTASPLISLLVGVTIAVALSGWSAASVMIGLVYGLSASGLYSQTKTLKKNNADVEDVL